MDESIISETELADTCNRYNIPFVKLPNNVIGVEVTRRQLLDIKVKLPNIVGKEASSKRPELEWESNSCYFDAFMMIFLIKHPVIDELIWETLTHKPVEDNKDICGGNVEMIREVWRQSIFKLMQNQRLSMRSFLKSLEHCKDVIQGDSRFWSSDLNDPIEFITKVFIPILMVNSKKGLIEIPETTEEYVVKPGEKEVEAKIIKRANMTNPVTLQVLNIDSNTIGGGDWLLTPETSVVNEIDFSDMTVFKSAKEWEYSGERREFKHETTGEIVKEADRTPEMASMLQRRIDTNHIIHPNVKVLVIGTQGAALKTIPTTIEKHGKKMNLVGGVLFKTGHYTTVLKENGKWWFYDDQTTYSEITEQYAIMLLKQQMRCVVYVVEPATLTEPRVE